MKSEKKGSFLEWMIVALVVVLILGLLSFFGVTRSYNPVSQNQSTTPNVSGSTEVVTTEYANTCLLQIEQEGRDEPHYIGLKGFIKASLDFSDYDQNLPKYPWSAPILQQTGPNLWELSNSRISAKTGVLVLEQHLTHQGYGRYTGFLIVQSLEDTKDYAIDVYNFVPTDYWNCPPHIAVNYGSFIAKIKNGVRPVNRNGEWEEIGELREVYCTGLADGKVAKIVKDGVQCVMYKNYIKGFGGVIHIFPSDGLEIIY